MNVTPAQLKVLNQWHNAAPGLFEEALKRFPVPPSPRRGMGDTSDDLSDALIPGSTATSTATPAASASSTGWLSDVTSFLSTALPSYLGYQTAKTQIAAGQTASTSSTAALLSQYGIGTAGGISVTELAIGGVALGALLWFVTRNRGSRGARR